MINGAKKRRDFVTSPHWPDSNIITKGALPKFVNPNFPFGVQPAIAQQLHSKEIVLAPKVGVKTITLKSGKLVTLSAKGKSEEERKALKQAKKDCVNMHNLTTIVCTSLDSKHAVMS